MFDRTPRAHLRDVFRGASGEVGRGESESTVCSCVIRLEVNGHSLFPPVAFTEVKAVHTDEPVGAGDHLHHQGQLPIRERETELTSNFTVQKENLVYSFPNAVLTDQ